MVKQDITHLLKLHYTQAVGFLRDKYGSCKYDYFNNENCASENSKAQRSNEGLFLHHIDENKYMNLSSRKVAKTYPYEAQKADRLVYCNYLEHLLLHVKIFKDYLESKCDQPATTGIFLFMVPELNTFYNTNKFVRNYNEMYGEAIKSNFEDYILILKYFIKISNPKLFDNNIKKRRKRFGATKIEFICKDYSGKVFEKVYSALKDAF